MPICARVTDMHVCPLASPATPPIPHVGGPVVGPGAVSVLVGKVPAANIGSMAICVGPPDTLATGSVTVIVEKMPCVRLFVDLTAHGGKVVSPGCPTVMVGG